MKKMNSKGFTLVELLAVITIMGVLMIVAIPAVSRTIENTRRDTFANTANQYINAVKNAVSADELDCSGTAISAVGANTYYVNFSTTAITGHTNYNQNQKDLIEQGGKSAWGSAEVKGYVQITKSIDDKNRTTYSYAIAMVDSGNRGMKTAITNPKRKDVVAKGGNNDYSSFAFKTTNECNVSQ